MDLTQCEVMGCSTSRPEPDLAWWVSRPRLREVRGLAAARHTWPHEGVIQSLWSMAPVSQRFVSLHAKLLLLRALESGPNIELVSSLTWDEDMAWAGCVDFSEVVRAQLCFSGHTLTFQPESAWLHGGAGSQAEALRSQGLEWWGDRRGMRHHTPSPPAPAEEPAQPSLLYCFIRYLLLPIGLTWWLSGKESTCNAGDPVSAPRSGRSPGGGHGNPLQYSCLENPMDRGAWRATVHRVTKGWTQLKWLSMCACIIIS